MSARDARYQTDALIATDIEAYLEQHQKKTLLRFITCGSVDDGKSTLIGRLLYDSKMIFEDQLAALEADSRRIGTQGQNIDFVWRFAEGRFERLPSLAAELVELKVDIIMPATPPAIYAAKSASKESLGTLSIQPRVDVELDPLSLSKKVLDDRLHPVVMIAMRMGLKDKV